MRALTRKVLVSWLPSLVLIFALGAIWQLYVTSADVNSVILPTPTSILETTWEERSLLLSDLSVTIREVILGFLIGLVAGMVCGILITYSRVFERVIYPIVVASQAVPVFAFAPLLVIWFGFGILPKVLMAAVLVFFPICVNQVEGLRAADHRAIDMLRAFGASEIRVFRSVRLPGSVPYLVAGTQVGMTFAVVGAVVAEWLGASDGLGYRMVVANSLSNTELVFAAILVTALLGIVMFGLVRIVANLLFPWQARSRRH